MVGLKTFYDEHPINESEILEKVEGEGIARDDIEPEDLSRYDQDHYDGLAANDQLAASLGIGSDMKVLDLCSGMGGTSRYLAYRYGATVLGVDLTESRVKGARALTRLVGLQDKVTYKVGDAAHLDIESETVDRIVSQESFLHIQDRENLFAECARVLKAGGGLGFTDWISTDRLDDTARAFLADGLAAPRIVGIPEYVSLLQDAGFSGIQTEDLSARWQTILHERLAMYQSLESETVARFGRDRFDTYIRNYAFFIEQIDSGALGGGRFVGWKRDD
ncbi:MAG: methyltransferase domain-containing protein [Alphaproteobacteria bacterium]|nr:methyltransferase domain-containing protein [Alphaproteobacteria bacterium]